MREMPDDVATVALLDKVKGRSDGYTFKTVDTGRKVKVALLRKDGTECADMTLEWRKNDEVFLHYRILEGVESPDHSNAVRIGRDDKREGPNFEHCAVASMTCLLCVVSPPVEIMEATRRGMSVSDEDFEAWKLRRRKTPQWAPQILQKRLQRIISYDRKTSEIEVSCGGKRRTIDLMDAGWKIGHPVATGVTCLEQAWTKIPSVEVRKNVAKMREVFRELQRRGYGYDGVKKVWDEEVVKKIMER
jgi:hypothetical protein